MDNQDSFLPMSKDLWALARKEPTALTFPLPFQQEIFLFETYIAGTSHILGIETISQQLMPQEKLFFYREPNNPYDAQAIAIETANQIKLGYVPKADNVIFARLLDAGKVLFARVMKVEKKGKWIQIPIRIFLEA